MNKKLLVFTLVSCSAFIVFIHGNAQSGYIFNRTMSVGTTGEDVRQMQKVLNSNDYTQIAATGPGSPGQETDYFGLRTKEAVVRFQELYKNDVLAPANLIRGTGYVGQLTLKKLNAISSNGLVKSSSGTISSTPALQAAVAVTGSDVIDIYVTDKRYQSIKDQINKKLNDAISSRLPPSAFSMSGIDLRASGPVIQKLSTNRAIPGTLLYIVGTGFSTTGNSVYFGNGYVIKNVPSSGGTTITLTAPSIPVGRYDVVVKSDSGVTNSDIFVVTSATTPTMSVQSVEPTTVVYGKQLTIHGTGFTSTNNEVITIFDKIKGVPSADGKTLVVTINPEAFREVAKLGKGNSTFPVEFRVANDNGYTNLPSRFNLTY